MAQEESISVEQQRQTQADSLLNGTSHRDSQQNINGIPFSQGHERDALLKTRDSLAQLTAPESNKAPILSHPSPYRSVYLKRYQETYPDNFREQELLGRLFESIDAHGEQNVQQFTKDGNGFLYASVNLNDVLEDAGIQQTESLNDGSEGKKRVDVISLGGYGSGLAANWDHFYMDAIRWLVPVANSNGRLSVHLHVLGDATAAGGEITRELLNDIGRRGVKPLGELDATFTQELLAKGNNTTTLLEIDGFSQGGNIAIELAAALKPNFEDHPSDLPAQHQNTTRVGQIELPNGKKSAIRVLVDNPANLDKGFNPMTILGAAYQMPKEHKSEIYQASKPHEAAFEAYLLSLVPHLQGGNTELQGKAKKAIGIALARGTNTDKIPHYKRTSTGNLVGATIGDALEMFKRVKNLKRAHAIKKEERSNMDSLNQLAEAWGYEPVTTMDITHPQTPSMFEQQGKKDVSTYIKGGHLAVQERQTKRHHRVVKFLTEMLKKREATEPEIK